MYPEYQPYDGDLLSVLGRLAETQPRPLLIYGGVYTGRTHLLYKYISLISRIPLPQLPEIDISSCSFPSTLPQLREFLYENRVTPLKLPYKFPIIRNFDLFPKNAQDLFLKVLEDLPPRFLPLITATSTTSIAPTILSRVVSLNLPTPPLSVLKTSPLFRDLQPLPNPLASLLKVRLDFKGFLQKLNTLPTPLEVLEMVESLLLSVSNLRDLPLSLVLPSFLSDLLLPELLLQASQNELYDLAFRKVLRNFQKSLFRYVSNPDREYYISLKYQLSGFLNSVVYLRRLHHV